MLDRYFIRNYSFLAFYKKNCNLLWKSHFFWYPISFKFSQVLSSNQNPHSVKKFEMLVVVRIIYIIHVDLDDTITTDD